jgi:DNA repair protein RecN (Recombination protein N)
VEPLISHPWQLCDGIVTAPSRGSVGAHCYTCCVLSALTVENLLLIERAELSLAPGLNVFTGETGAGKTVLAHALDLLLGGRSRPGIVRPGSSEAYVEGVFDISPALHQEIARQLPACVSEAEYDSVIVARRVGLDGRTRAFVNGRTITVSDLRELGVKLLTFYGQHEHRKLTLATAQLAILDAFCGVEHERRLEECARIHRDVHKLEVELEDLEDMSTVRERELDLLNHEIAEIEAAAPQESEYQDLLVSRERLKRLDSLQSAVSAATEALTGEGAQGRGALELLALSAASLEAVENVDPQLDALSARQRTLLLEAEDLSSELRRYSEQVGAGPADIDSIEDRLAELERLMRKHGESISAVLEHAERSRTRRDQLLGAEVAFNDVTQRLQATRSERDQRMTTLHETRSRAAPLLSDAVRERLKELAMPEVSFEIRLIDRDPGPSGRDGAEFEISTNPGVRPGPLREIASGGELSRVMLALTTVDSHDGAGKGSRDALQTLIFDEVDAGIGGHTARIVGERLHELGEQRQVLCITHLAQIASLADRHFSVAKDTSAKPTRTTVRQLEEAEMVSELVRMLGASDQDTAARSHVEELRRAA